MLLSISLAKSPFCYISWLFYVHLFNCFCQINSSPISQIFHLCSALQVTRSRLRGKMLSTTWIVASLRTTPSNTTFGRQLEVILLFCRETITRKSSFRKFSSSRLNVGIVEWLCPKNWYFEWEITSLHRENPSNMMDQLVVEQRNVSKNLKIVLIDSSSWKN